MTLQVRLLMLPASSDCLILSTRVWAARRVLVHEAESEKGGVRGWSSALEPPLLLHLRQSSIQSTRQPVTSDLKFSRIFAHVKRVQRHDLLIVSPSGRWTVDSTRLC
ncbi:hypothetical protein Pmani_025580 [Petrolisthes manimaculis]|uniref:Uncharacterized protein n=1 Tax=Petrolisthes manimaculis TaxID=1843537 RepID=A0AAE1U114_9EUCA|nr:hypothetical protein Pmani_025580 [Petrolisthes manimaculis]